MKKIADSNFKRLIGIWKTAGHIQSEEGVLLLSGIDSYELILDDTCILHKADVMMGDQRSETFEIIKLDDSHDAATMHYFNANGEHGIMRSSITGNKFQIEGKGLKFSGTINDSNTTIRGKWLMQSPGQPWTEFIDLHLEKQVGSHSNV